MIKANNNKYLYNIKYKSKNIATNTTQEDNHLSKHRITTHSGFGPFDCPIWTDFLGGKLPTDHTFFGKSYRENQNGS